MHPSRRHILFRWVFAVLVVSCMAGWLAYSFSNNQPQVQRSKSKSVTAPELPAAADMAALNDAITVVRHISNQAPPVRVAQPDPALMGAEGQQGKMVAHGPPLELAMIFTSEASRFASFGDSIYKEGQKIDDKRRLLEIERESVLIETPQDTERVWWSEPMRVSLVKADPEAEEQTEDEGRQVQQEEGRIPDDMEQDPEVQAAMPQTLNESSDSPRPLTTAAPKSSGSAQETANKEDK